MNSQPKLSLSSAHKICREYFGVDADLSPLESERDQNFLVDPRNQDHRCVLKISNSQSELNDLILENAALIDLQQSSVSDLVPRPQTSCRGHYIEELQTDSGNFPIRMLSFHEGETLACFRPHSSRLLEQLGDVLGKMTLALSAFQHSVATPDFRRGFDWNLDDVQETLNRHQWQLESRDIIEPFLKNYRNRVQPRLKNLRRSLIHNDANDHNVIISPADHFPPRIVGIIDFGDMAYASTVNELAIAIAYVMLEKNDPLNAASAVVRGFHHAFPLTEDEFEIVFDLAIMRLCTSVVMASFQRSKNPENEYLSVTDMPARKTLSRLQKIHPEFAAAYFRTACNKPSFTSTEPIKLWINQNKKHFFPLLDKPLSEDNLVVFDLSVASTDSLSGDLGADSPDQLFRRISDAKKTFGLGRYLEPRTCYQGKQFKSDSEANALGDEAEPRTIHMGVDLFARPGTPIHAPLNGIVFSLADNNVPFDYGPTIILEHQVENNTQTEGSSTFYTLYGHLSRDSLAGLKAGNPVQEGAVIGKIGTAEENGGWPPHLHFQVMSHMLGLSGNYPGVVKPSELELWKNIILDPGPFLNLPNDCYLARPTSPDTARPLREKHLSPSLSLSYEEPIKVVRGQGQYLFDDEGRPFLDCVNNVCHLGHCHPYVAKAASQQLNLLNTNTRYLHDEIGRYAQRLANQLPGSLEVCYFVNSGSEANDLALRLARNFTGRHEVICIEGGYHGNLSSLIEVSPYKYNSAGGSGRPEHVHEIPVPDSYRGVHRESVNSKSLGKFYAEYVFQAIDQSKLQNSSSSIQSCTGYDRHQIAAFICESVISCGGQIVLPENYLKEVYQFCHRAGILCIADEVQVGFGRVGSDFWGFQTQDVIPDIVTMGKPIGNGFPLGAVVTTNEIAAKFNNGMEYFNTFGGSPVAASVGNAVLDVIENERLQHHAQTVGTYFLEQLASLQNSYPVIGDVRGVGLFLGLEFVSAPKQRTPNAALASYVVERMKKRGVLLSTDGPDHNVIKIKPPMCFSKQDVDRVIYGLSITLDESFPRSWIQE